MQEHNSHGVQTLSSQSLEFLRNSLSLKHSWAKPSRFVSYINRMAKKNMVRLYSTFTSRLKLRKKALHRFFMLCRNQKASSRFLPWRLLALFSHEHRLR